MQSNGKKISLAVKFYILVTMIVLVTAFSVTTFVLRKESADNYDKLINKGVSTANFIAQLSEFGVFSEDKEILFQIMYSIKDQEISYVAILRKDRSKITERFLSKPFIRFDFPSLPTDQIENDLFINQFNVSNKEKFIQFLVPILSAENAAFDSIDLESAANENTKEKIGYVHLIYNQQKIIQERTENFRLVFLVTAFIVVFAILITFVLINRILQPVGSLVKATKNIAAGDLDTPIDTTSND
jgi:methyl-accepting chemotaxis protein